MKTNRFRLVDTVADASILAILFVPHSMLVPNEDALLGSSFLAQLFHLAIVFVCYFGMAFFYSDVYYVVARRRRKLETFELLNEPLFLILSFTIVISLGLSAYAIWTQMKMPIFTSIVVGVQALMFGLSFGMEVNYQADTSQERAIESSIKRLYGRSIPEYLPYVVLTFAIMYPLDFLLGSTEMAEKPILLVLVLLSGLFATYYIGKRIEKWIGPLIEIGKTMNLTTVVATSVLTVIGILSLGYMQLVAINNDLARTDGLIGTVVVLLMFGIIPLRITRLLMLRHHWATMFIGAATMAIYLLREFKII